MMELSLSEIKRHSLILQNGTRYAHPQVSSAYVDVVSSFATIMPSGITPEILDNEKSNN
jgi:hypothetical protein